MAQAKTYHDSVIERKSTRPESGFKAMLPPQTVVAPHEFTSCNQHSYGNPGRASSTAAKKLKDSDAVFAGQGKPKTKKPAAANMKLAGEVWKDGSDPQKSTLAQRSWMYQVDPAIQFKLKGCPEIKNLEMTGFPVGSEFDAPYNPNGNYRRVAKITKCSDAIGNNARQGKNIWMDQDA